MAGPLAFVPVIMAGARAITRVAPKVAEQLFRQGKAKPAKDGYNTLKSEIEKKTEKGFKAIVKGRSVSRLPTKEANALIKQGRAQNAKSVLKSLENAMKSAKETRPIKPLQNPLIIKKATGGLLKNSSKPLGIGKALRGWGKGYK